MKKINIPEGGHQAVLLGDQREMVEAWSVLAVEIDAHVVEVFGMDQGLGVDDVVPTIAYAHVAKAAYGLCSAATLDDAEFDPVEFGLRCTAVAREQLARYAKEHRADGGTETQ
jgi:hypothetical protein